MTSKVPLRYVPLNVNDFDNVVPSRTDIPKWYKDTPRYLSELPVKDARKFIKSYKACPPFLEAMTVGYLITTSYDLVVAINEFGNPDISWLEGNKIIGVRDKSLQVNFPTPYGHHDVHFLWMTPASLVVPRGYSILLTQPLNRVELPFTTLSGVVDGGYALAKDGGFPFFLKKDFEGVIPQGTPVLQAIPFKNEHWVSKKDPSLKDEAELNDHKTLSVLEGWYKNTFWTKKQYD